MTGNGSSSSDTPTPRTRRTTRRIRKTPADAGVETEATSVAATAEPHAEAATEAVAPRPRVRRTRRAATADSAEPAVDASSSEEAPAPRARRARTEEPAAERPSDRRDDRSDEPARSEPPLSRSRRWEEAASSADAPASEPSSRRSPRSRPFDDAPAQHETLDHEWYEREPWEDSSRAGGREAAASEGDLSFDNVSYDNAESGPAAGSPGESAGPEGQQRTRRGRRGGRRRRGGADGGPANGQQPRQDANRPQQQRYDQNRYNDQNRYGDQPGGGSRGANDGGAGPGRRRRRRRRGGGIGAPPAGQTNFRRDQGAGPRDHRSRGGQPQHRNQHFHSDEPIGETTGTVEGVLELHPKGYGFLRDVKKNYVGQDSDAFVSGSVIERHRLREGILIKGEVGAGTRGQGPRLKNIISIDGRTVEEYAKIKPFDELTPINPFEQIKLETGARPVTMRVMDLLTPIGKGQRALIVAPPRSGKTMLLQDIADAVSANHPELHLIVVLIDERPEEVTEMRRRVKGEVIASSMDRDVESHIRTSQLIFERARRLAEAGGEVFILLDSVTRLARAFNKGINTGRTGTGGLDVRALDIPRKIFGTARRFDEGGSLTVVATALIDTGSRMDDAIFQEFKGTGNMELVLSRDLADRRIWPAMDISMSGTRREEKILSKEVLDGVTLLRRSLVSMNQVEAMEQLIRTLERFPTNAEFLARVRNIL